MGTSLDFEFGGQVVEVPVEGVGHDSTETDSAETGLLSDQGELEEGHEEEGAGEVAHSGESFALATVRV